MQGTADHQTAPRTILVVEDDHDTREFIVLLLELASYHVVEAATGQSAIAAIGQQPIHGVLLDMRLPDMDGLAVCQHYRADGYTDIPIILVTADIASDITNKAKAAGVTACINKPFEPQALIDQLKHLIGS